MWRALRNTVTRARALRATDPALRSLRACHFRSASSRILRFIPDDLRSAAPRCALRFPSARRAGRRLADLAPHALVDVADALALVRLRRPQCAQVGRELSDPAAVDAFDPDDHVAVDGHREAFGHRELDRMREAEQQGELLARDLRAIADALDLELSRERRHH